MDAWRVLREGFGFPPDSETLSPQLPNPCGQREIVKITPPVAAVLVDTVGAAGDRLGVGREDGLEA